MTKAKSKSAYIEDDRFREVFQGVQSHLKATRASLLLESEIRETSWSLELAIDKLETLHHQLDSKKMTVTEIEEKLAVPAANLADHKTEKSAVEDEFENSGGVQENIIKKKTLSGLQAEIGRLNKKIRPSKIKLGQMEASLEDMMHLKENLSAQKISLQEKITEQGIEIPEIRNVRDILAGMMPENFDSEVYQSIQGGLEKSIDQYIEEIRKESKNARKESAELNSKLIAGKEEEERLLSLTERLKSEIKELSAFLGDDFNEESLKTSKNELCARKYRLEQEAIENREAVLEYESANTESDDRLARMSKIEEALKNQRSHLDSFKNEMEKVDDPVQEIERLQEKTWQYDQETRAIQNFLRISNKISEDISRTNARMQSVFDNREKRVLEFEQFIEQVLP